MTYYCIMPDRGGYVICTWQSGNKGNPQEVDGTELYADKAGAGIAAALLAEQSHGIYIGDG